MKLVHLISLAVGLSLSACGIADDGGMRSPLPVAAGGGAAAGSNAARSGSGDLPSQPTYAQPPDSGDHNIPGQREVHAVASVAYCQQMLRNFKAQGIRLRLDRVKPTGDPNLPFLCIFLGEDAMENRFAEERYNNPQEYQ